jgi:16S rRNA (adenine1518-N6/adenine1519-N6)-dimethyltransferase
MERHGLRPRPSLGQHFLLDENLIAVSVREGAVGPDDVVLEIGAGAGVLTRALAGASRHVHAVEVDRRLEPVLADALSAHDNVSLIWGDALKLDLAALVPAPTRLIANLPYDIAGPLMLESLTSLRSVERWCVMVQREVADRWGAPPGGKDYGAPSVLIGLACRQEFRRNVGREVFSPRPHVDSALVAYARIGPGPDDHLRTVVRAAFGHRRKTLVNALREAGFPRERTLAALVSVGHVPEARPADLSAEDYRSLAGALR